MGGCFESHAASVKAGGLEGCPTVAGGCSPTVH